MKHFMIILIKIYKMIPFNSHKYCKYIPSCSTYALESYERYGFFYGSYLTIKRLLRCTPWNHSNIYDPVPNRRKNEKNI